MRKSKTKSPESNLNCVRLQNGLMLKASYAYNHAGFYVSLFVVNAVGRVLANRNYGFSRTVGAAQDMMCLLLNALKQLCLALKLDHITQPRIQESAAKSILLVLTREAVFQSAA